jgi:type IV pilus assembly protein PilC
MAKFTYTAVAADGTTVSGVQVAPSSGVAHQALHQQGLQPIGVQEKKSFLQFEVTQRKVRRKHVMHFSRQLAVFIKAGIPILDALEVISEETTDKLFKKALGGVIESLKAGDTFAAAAAAHAEAFPRFYVGILESAELTGNLDVVLEQLAEYIERDLEARRKVTSALTYPSIVMGMAVVTVVVLAGFVLPKFKTFFKSLDAKLPLATRMLLSVADFVAAWWFALGGGALALVVIMAAARRSQAGRAKLDAILLRIPVAGDLVRHAILERVCRILASMMRAGVPLPDAMVVTADATNNAVYRRGLNTVRAEMLQGRGLAGPVAQSGLFPGALRQMFRVGEDTGTLDQQLQTAAIYYDRELDYRIKRFTSLFEPAVIVAVGLVVGFVAVALVSAMYGIYHQVKV